MGGDKLNSLAAIYPIKNLNDFNCKYKIYKIRGLLKTSSEFEINKEKLIKHLSFSTKSPCAFLMRDEKYYVAQLFGFDSLPTEINLVRCQVRLEEIPQLRSLDFGNLSDNEVQLAIRFLTFSLSNPLYSHPELWQPSSGKTYFFKKPEQDFDKRSLQVSMHRGFSYGIVLLPNNKLGISLDVTSKYLSKNRLPEKLSEQDFQNIKSKKCVYEYGNNWYEITISGLEGLSASEFKLRNNQTLKKYVLDKIGHILSKRNISISDDCSVISYFTQLGQANYVVPSLCRLTYDTNDPSIRSLHYRTQLSPLQRFNEIQNIMDRFFANLKFNNTSIILDGPIPLTGKLPIPDLKFGNGVILSTNSTTPNAVFCHPSEFGKTKSELLTSVNAGFFKKKDHLEKQYFIIPQSIALTCGNAFLRDLRDKFSELYGKDTDTDYNPEMIQYSDENKRTIASIGNEIVSAAESDFFRYGGFAVVMIPRLRSKMKEDELASLVHKEFRKRDIFPAIIHTDVVKKSYEKMKADDGGTFWRKSTDPFIRKKLRGYLHNVVLNKILLLNSCWPFVLENGLEADLIIGIDVKNHTAGFSFFYGDNTEPRTFSSVTSESEKLSKDHVHTKLIDFIRKEQRSLSKELKKIVVHRDGRLYKSEEEGILNALYDLVNEGLVSKDFDCSFLEIKKSARAPVRFFSIQKDNSSQEQKISNPTIGTYLIVDHEAYLSTTGYPYRLRGTSRPIHMIKKSGNMSLEKLVKDVFALTNLTWTKIDGCLRSPMTIKLVDSVLREEAGKYEEDKLNFAKIGVKTNE